MADRSAVIIGGGISGVLCARELNRAGFSVTVLEARHLGAGSSSRTAAGIRQQFSMPDTVRAMRYAVGRYGQLAQELGESVLVQNGYLFLFDESGHDAAAARVEMQREAGLTEVELLEPATVGVRHPYVDTQLIAGATFCPTDGFLLPHLIYNGAAELARSEGVSIVQNARVTGSEGLNRRLNAVKTSKGLFAADLFLDCTNAWTRRTASLLGASELHVDPLKRYLNFVRRDEEGMSAETLQSMPLIIVPTGAYCRPESQDTLMVGKMHYTEPQYDFDYEDQDEVETPYSFKDGIDAFPFSLWAEVAEYLPPIGAFGGLSATTAGFYGTTPDHNPFLAYDPLLDNLIRLVGFSGHGAMMGPFTAAVARALAEAGENIDRVTLPDIGTVGMQAFAIGRAYASEEKLVI